MRVIWCVWAGVLGLIVSLHAPLAQPTTSSDAAAAASSSSGLDAAILEAVFDDYFAPANGLSYTGAAIAVVQDGRPLFIKGYGFADAARTRPVDPNATPFGVGSVTKTLVGVALAQLLDAGAIASIDDPVNQYLTRTQLPDNAGVPITIRMLATHQAGFADRRQPYMGPGDTASDTTGADIDQVTPRYIRPTASGAAYSNFGIAVLGYMIEDITSQSFDDYLQNTVFGPAGMTEARIIKDPSDRGDTAQGEAFYPNGGRRAIPTTWANNHTNKAAGGLVMSARDAARYMIAVMGGSPNGQIASLTSDNARDVMTSRLGEIHPLVQAFGLTFMVNDWNGVRVVEHGGRTLGAASYLILLPDEDIGIFIAVTGENGTILPVPALLGQPAAPPPRDDAVLPVRRPILSTMRAAALEALLGRSTPPIPLQPIDLDLTAYAGEYAGERRPVRNVAKLFHTLLLGAGPVVVKPTGDGALVFGGYGRYEPVAPDIFYKTQAREQRGASGWSDLLVFRRDEQGKVVDAALTYADVIFEKHTGLFTPTRMMLLFQIGALGLLITGLVALVWPRRTLGKWVTAAMPIAIIALPLVYFRSWPRTSLESLNFLLIDGRHLMALQLLGNLLALGAMLILVSGALTFAPSPSTASDNSPWRRATGTWHRRLLIPIALCFLIGLVGFDLVGWNL